MQPPFQYRYFRTRQPMVYAWCRNCHGRGVHGSFQGGMSMVQGGKFIHGFAAGAMGSLSGAYSQGASPELQMIIAAGVGGTAATIGGGKPASPDAMAIERQGKFANGAVTGAYVMMFNHLMEQIEINRFQKKYFGQVKGLNKIYTDAVPDGYTLNEKVGLFINSEGGEAAGVTIYLGEGLSDVYLSPAAQTDAFTLYEILGHEMIHVAHHNHFLASHVLSHSEYAAYTWSMAVHNNLYGKDKGYFELVRKLSKFEPNRAYNYDKFDFSSSIPRNLWNY